MKVRFYNFTKRRNSTKQPDAQYSYTEKECLLKDDTSVHDPVLQIAGGPNVAYNFAYIPDWDKYYFVNDCVSVANGISEYSLTEDSMASGKTSISSTMARLLYAPTITDSMIPDTRIMVSTKKRSVKVSGSTAFLDNTGVYSLTVFNGDQSSYQGGMGTTYLLDSTGMENFKAWLLSGSVYSDLHQFFNGPPLDAVFSCLWLPFSKMKADGITLMGTSVDGIDFGNQTMSGTPYAVTVSDNHIIRLGIASKVLNETINFASSLVYSDFRKMEPYTTCVLNLPGIGSTDLQIGDIQQQFNSIYVTCSEDYISGSILYTVYGGDSSGPILHEMSGKVGCVCPLGQLVTNVSGEMNAIKTGAAGIITAAAGVASSNPLMMAGGVGAIITAGSNMALASNQRTVHTHGSANGHNTYQLHVTLTIYYVDTEDPTTSDYVFFRGRPCGGVHQIGSLGDGYYQCDDGTVLIGGSEKERDDINAMLNSGFYYE